MFFNKHKEEALYKAYEKKAYVNLEIVKQHKNKLVEEDQKVLRACYDTCVLPIDFGRQAWY